MKYIFLLLTVVGIPQLTNLLESKINFSELSFTSFYLPGGVDDERPPGGNRFF